uniref:Ovule protein n=1 Tax=Heterorhabditis bacteriophora TaxID=37862 RepID=A0A1I7WDU3_HETBA
MLSAKLFLFQSFNLSTLDDIGNLLQFGFRLDNGLLRVYLSSLGFRPAIYICFFCSVLRGLELPFCAFFQGALDQTPVSFMVISRKTRWLVY